MKQVDNQILDLPGNEVLGNIQEIKIEINNKVKSGSLTIFGSDKSQNDIAKRSDQLSTAKTIIKLSSAINTTTRAADYRTISGTVPNYSYNTNNICAATASAMYLRYCDIYVNGKYVPSSLETTDGVALIMYLTNYIPGGAIPYQVLNGLWSFLSLQGVSNSIAAYTASTTSISSSVGSNKPYIMLINGAPTYGNHYVTGYGYNFDYNNSNFAIVNDGWGSKGIQINIYYAHTVIY